jgi:hypothetical protein
MADYSALTAPPKAAGPDYSALTARPMSVGEDMLRSGLSGLQRGVVGLIGLPGDVRDLAAQGFEAATGYELPNMPSWMPAQIGPIPTGSKTSAQYQRAYENFGGPTHTPQTTAGEYAQTAGEFAPAAIGGAGGLIRRGAQALIPALASETAGQVTRHVAPEYENAARVGAAIATGGVGARAGASKLPKGAAPSTDELGDMARIAYDRADKAGLVMRPASFGTMVRDAVSNVVREGIDKTIHPKAHAAANRLVQVVSTNQPLTLQQFDTLRRVVRGAAKSIEPDERRLANIIIDRMDEYLDTIKAKDIAAGDLRMANSSIKEARSLWRRMRKSELIDDALERAGVRAGQFSVAGKENAIRTEFRQYALRMTRDKRFRNTFTPEEQKLIRQLGNMGSTVNILRTLGKLAPRSALTLGGGAAYAYSEQDPLATGAAWGVGELGRLAALGLTKRKARLLSERVRSGGAQLIPGAPASPASAVISSQAATLPWRLEQ